MKLLDRIAINSLIKTITGFILAILKIFVPTDKNIVAPERKRPLKDLIDRIFKK
jgi:hypothetical protein